MEKLNDVITAIDDFVWGPVMLILLVGTGIFLTVRTRFLTWRNLGYALKSTLSKEARTKSHGEGDVSPFSALTTALAATIGTGNIVGVATAMVSGGPGALVWMWISAAFGLTSKFSECMLAIKYREINAKGEMSGGPMYTMKKALKNKRFGAVLAWLFALFAVIASFGIGNMTQGNSISGALYDISCADPSDRNCDYGACPADHCRRYQNHFKGFFGGRSADGDFLCDLWSYCYYRKYFESAGRHFDDFSDGIFGKSGRRRSVRNDCRFHDECNALWCGKRCIFQRSRYGICGNYGSGCNDG